jgi:hypothetical protein
VTQGLGICEGIETGCTIITELGWRPIWAVGDAGAMRTFPLLAGLDCLTLFPDNDTAKRRSDGTLFYPGQDAAAACAERLLAKGLPEVAAIIPPAAGSDWNDATGRAAA